MKQPRWLWIGILAVVPAAIAAQDRLKTMPGYERALRLARESTSAVSGGALQATWADDSRSFAFARKGTNYRYDVAARQTSASPPADGERRAPDPLLTILYATPPLR